ncbi:metallophosphoesterase family protein [Pendulispora albinea]|uniref:Metallophosphoesterase n=1 Tax=Pendulispora albinea TaxID=2741071 RepID=A0ABZ2LLE9_9BACT
MRIAHFSDLHILSLAGVLPHRFLNKRLSGYANLKLKRGHIHRPAYVRAIAREIARTSIDHVAITGDITNLALEPEFEAARALLQDALGLDPKNVSVVPGNHDLYTRGALRTRRFMRYFGPFVESDLPELAVDIGLGRFPFVRLRGPLAIVGLSSAVPRLPFVAAGRIGERQLDAFARVLAHPDVRSRTPVVLLHHPVQNPPSRLKTLLEGLEDADALTAHVQGFAHGLILHGHLHRRQQRHLETRAGKLHVVGATSASLHHDTHEKMASFNVYEFDDTGKLVEVESHILEPETETFRVTEVPHATWS